jgi:cytidylate kinase
MSVKICISGFTACGKTTLIKELAKFYKCKYISFSTFLIKNLPPQIALKYKNSENWYQIKDIDKNRLKFVLREKNIDKKFYNFINSQEKIIFDSFSYPFISYNKSNRAFCVFIKSSIKIRTKRAYKFIKKINPSVSLGLVKKFIQNKDLITKKILQKNWKINIFSKNYLKYFDLIINDSYLEKEKKSKKQVIEQKKKMIIHFYNLYLLANLRRNLYLKK